MEKVWYFIQVSICVSIFYGLYFVFFKNTTFFIANRIYLLAGLIFSFIIPVLNLSVVPQDSHLTATEFIERSAIPLFDPSPQVIEPISAMTPFSWILTTYWMGFAFMIVRLGFSIAHVMRLKRNATMQRNGKTKIWRAHSIHPFSFLNQIFLPRHDVSPLVVEHEKAHVRLQHGMDLVLLEIACALLWFNPIMILYRRAITIQHEYEADESVVTKSGKLEEYLSCIVRHLQNSNTIGPISQFNTTLNIKTRILMMTKKKTSWKFSLLYLLCIPVGCILLFAFSNPAVPSLTLTNSTKFADDDRVVIIVDAGHGGQDSGGKTNSGMSEKDVALSIAKGIQREGEANQINVILTRTGDEPLTLDERIAVTNNHKADAFISLHTNFDRNVTSAGIECMVSESNPRFNDSKRLADNLLQELQTLNGISVNGIMKSDFRVLSKNSIPAILLEIGYISNEKDYKYVTDPENQKRISRSIITAVVKYAK